MSLQGLELSYLRQEKPYKRIVYIGDGANDLCPALKLGPQDLVLARTDYDLDRLIQERKHSGLPHAAVHHWSTHQQLFTLLQEII